MKIRNIFQLGFVISSLALFGACGDDSSSSASDEESSSSVASFRSSSSLSTRADIDYKDTLKLGDTTRVYIELFNGDSSKMDESEVYIDSAATSVPLYLGEFTKGSRIRVYAFTTDIKEDRIRIKNEFGNYMPALTAVPKNESREDSVYSNYIVASLGSDTSATFRDSNQFIVFSDNHYYLEIGGEFSNESNVRLKVAVDTAYYKYTGDEENISMKMSDTVRGIIDIDNSPDEIALTFSASEGYSVNLKTTGKNIVQYKLTSNDSLLGQFKSGIDTMLVPKDSIRWNLKISAESFSNFLTGPYAFFEATTKARELEQGEYFSNPDSIPYPGEAYLRTRPKDDPNKAIYKYNLRQEQFVWIGDYKKGDSVLVKHWIANYSDDGFTSPVTYEILDKNQKVQGTISSTYGGTFSVKSDMPEGPYYLHYLRLNSDPLDQVYDSLRYVLQLYTMVQQPGLLKKFSFYNIEKQLNYNKTTLSAGDTIRFSNIVFEMEPVKETGWTTIGSDISWFIPCESIAYLNNSSNYKAENCDTEQEISSDYLIALEDGIGETAKLIAQSVADPAKRDTLQISIIAKAN